MKIRILFVLFLCFSNFGFSQEVIDVTGKGKLIADFSSVGEAPNVKGVYLEKYQTLVSIIEGTQTVKCMVRVESTVNVIGVWELNDLNDIQVKVFEVEMESGFIDILLIGITDEKAISMNLFRKSGEDLNDLGYNYIEQKIPGEQMKIAIGDNKIQVVYDKDSEQPVYGLVGGVFKEID